MSYKIHVFTSGFTHTLNLDKAAMNQHFLQTDSTKKVYTRDT